MSRFTIIAALGFLTLCIMASPGANVSAYPTLQYYVTDLAGVLFEPEVTDIEYMCDQVYLTTGAEIAVLVVNTTQPDDINHYTVETFELNAIGQAGEDNGVLIVVSTDERLWRIEVGYGLTPYLTAPRVGEIGTYDLAPYLNQSLYYEGIYGAVLSIADIIVNEYVGEPVEERLPYPISWIPLTLWQLVAVASVVIFLAVITKGRLFLWIPLLFMGGKGGKKWGGGRSGGSGAKGKW